MTQALTIVCATVAVFALGMSLPNAADMTRTRSVKPTGEVKTASGLKYIDLVVGKGPKPLKGQTIETHYTGWLVDGKKFDSSVDRGRTFKVKIGVGRVIKGFDEGLMGMRVGGKRRITIPPDLGYGSRNMTVIPPNSTLIFEVELIGIE